MANQNIIAKAKDLFNNIDLSRPGTASAGNLRTMIDGKVAEQMENGLDLPASYSSSNALTAALLRLNDVKSRNNVPAMQCCTPASILQALMDMVVQGLSPNKNQCYFIVYGNQLQMRRSYFGTVAALTRLSIVKEEPMAQVVHDGDEFEIGADENFQTIVTKFKPNVDSLDKPIKFAFAIITTTDGKKHYTIMTRKDIEASWSQSNNHAVQQKFGQEMAKRTVLNRAAKMYVNTSDDSDLISGALNDTVAAEQGSDDERRDVTPQKQEDQTQTIIDTIGKSKSAKSEEPKQEEKPKKAPRKKSAKPKVPKKKSVGGDDHADSNEDEEYPVVEGQTDLFENETIKPKATIDAE